MQILVIGSGGREHALVWKLLQSPKVKKLFCTPGNGGTANIAENIDIPVTDIQQLLSFAKQNKIDLTIVGPEVPLALGIVDLFNENNLKIFGPNQKASQLESSKSFSKQIMREANIPTAAFEVFDSPITAKKYLQQIKFPTVIKADGLAAGKGVVIVDSINEAEKTIDQIMASKVFGAAGDTIVIEEFLTGEEASLLAFTDGYTVLPMASAQDHKAIYEKDTGPNTGGMGAYSPAPILNKETIDLVTKTILTPVINILREKNILYKGVLYAGLMLTDYGPKVLEFNVRFGDPETQVILPRLQNDLVDIILATLNDTLEDIELQWTPEFCLSVVLAAGGYPGSYDKGDIISGLDQIKDAYVFHAGTKYQKDDLVTSGGRVLNVTSLGNTIKDAQDKAYQEISKIKFQNMYYRKDIGWKALRD